MEENESDDNDDDNESGEGIRGGLEEGDRELYSFESIEAHEITEGIYQFKVLWTSGAPTWESVECPEDCIAKKKETGSCILLKALKPMRLPKAFTNSNFSGRLAHRPGNPLNAQKIVLHLLSIWRCMA